MEPELINIVPNWFYWIISVLMGGALIFIFKHYISQQVHINRQVADSIKILESFVQVQIEKNKNFDKDLARLESGTKTREEAMKQMTLTLKHMDDTLTALNYERVPRTFKKRKNDLD
jgi:septal ring factor EnvC (AmiA/AmiB activator)